MIHSRRSLCGSLESVLPSLFNAEVIANGAGYQLPQRTTNTATGSPSLTASSSPRCQTKQILPPSEPQNTASPSPRSPARTPQAADPRPPPPGPDFEQSSRPHRLLSSQEPGAPIVITVCPSWARACTVKGAGSHGRVLTRRLQQAEETVYEIPARVRAETDNPSAFGREAR